MTPNSIPMLRRGIRRRYDAARGQNVLLGPERIVMLDEIACAITDLCDAKNSIRMISEILAKKYSEDAGQIENDVICFVQELVEKGLVGT